MNTSEYEYGLNLTLTLTYVNVKCSNKLNTINVSSVYSKYCIRCWHGGGESGMWGMGEWQAITCCGYAPF